MPKAIPKSVPCGTGNPTEPGVYACRTLFDEPIFGEDRFLAWDGGWWYLSSDVGYRGKVISWVGPLPRTNGNAQSATS